jgi:hypothetical protein
MPNTVRLVMKNMLCICALLALGAGPASAYKAHANSPAKVQASSMTKQQRKLCDEAAPLRKAVIKKYGRRAPGRDICRFGVRGGSLPSVKKLSDYLQTLQRQISPPAVHVVSSAYATKAPPPVTSGTTPVAQSSSTSNSGSSSLPACASESGTNYSTGSGNTNPSGATGRYQIIPSTHASVCGDLGWTPSEQDQCAARIYRAQGASAWTNCG